MDEDGVVLTPLEDQNLLGELIFEKNLINSSGAPLTGREGQPALRYLGELKLLIECYLSEAEGQGAISQVILFDQDDNIAVKRSLPLINKTKVLEFIELFYYRF